MKPVFISICIPAYKRQAFLSRLLDSILVQTFTDFEVVVTDDSDTDEVSLLCDQYRERMTLHYYRNEKSLGTPANWNEAIRKATGAWIKLMHDDDWFADENSLEKFAEVARQAKASFIFSGYRNVDTNGRTTGEYNIGNSDLYLLKKSPVNLMKNNFIGPPSNTLVKHGLPRWYDERFKWLVDVEFYIRALAENNEFYAIPASLINIGISDSQVTKTAFRNPAIEIPENLEMLNLVGTTSLKRLFVYDHYWRFIRNLNIRNQQDITKYFQGNIPMILEKMVSQQSKYPPGILRIGVFSKLIMSFTYCINRLKGRMK